ncbi:MAG: DegT/DnrJ/EryC1/StrS family aminotransferase [Salinisphaera sp.]|nr:DegT/DnrJ/EryC1/StrS family aminotransferase [Salinisphaera sp.]
MQIVDLQAQYQRIRTDVDQRMRVVLEHGQYVMGPEVEELESRLAAYVGGGECVAVSSGTDALLLALMALDIGPGDEVITTPFTFIATGEMIALIGARPVFVDTCADTYNINPERVEAAITDRSRAILPVSLYGQCADMAALEAVSQRHGIPVIEDAAQSFGATQRGRRSCALSPLAATSFFPSKPLGCYGDGGAVFASDPVLAERMRELRNHGQDRRYHHPRVGINGRLDTLQAAILLAKLAVFDDEVAARQQVAKRYDELLAGKVTTPRLAAGNTSVYAQYTIEVDHRDAVQAALSEQGIPTAVHYPVPLNRQPALATDVAVPVAEAAAQRVLSLPMHPYLSEQDQQTVAAAVLRAIGA